MFSTQSKKNLIGGSFFFEILTRNIGFLSILKGNENGNGKLSRFLSHKLFSIQWADVKSDLSSYLSGIAFLNACYLHTSQNIVQGQFCDGFKIDFIKPNQAK